MAAVGDRGTILDAGIIDHALRQWPGPKESAFILCFQPPGDPIDWTLALAALDNVARALTARGAIAVVNAGRVCDTPPSAAMKGKPYVEIMGALRPGG